MKSSLLLLLAPCLATAAPAARLPNILLCVADDASYPHMSAYGTRWVRTPGFDRIAREGLLFDRAYTPNAKCAPSRACLLTGRNSWQLEEAANHDPFYPAGYRTIFEALARRGYAAGFTGKGWAPGVPGQAEGKPRELTGREYNQERLDPPTTGISPKDYAANFAEFLRARSADQPFIFWYGAHEPHRAYEYGTGVTVGGKAVSDIDRVPAHWPDREIVRNDLLDYALEIEHFDRHLERMVARLEQAGELENTLIIVTADNGMPFPRVKGASYELSHHLPLAIRWGGHIARPGRRVAGYVSLIDIVPTLLELTGFPAAEIGMEPAQGRSLLPVFRGEADGAGHVLLGQERHDVGRPADVGYPVRGLFAEDFLYLKNFETGRWPMGDPITGYLNTDGSPTKTLILADNRRGVNHWLWERNFGRRPPEELYDLRTDPDCLANLASDPVHAARTAQMRERLWGELSVQRDPRIAGQGEVFDRYVYSNPAVRDFYQRRVEQGEAVKANWIENTDYEALGFDPEAPLGQIRPAPPSK